MSGDPSADYEGDDPIARFLARRAAAIAAGAPLHATACVLATATPEGRPSARVVLVKEVGPDGFVFYTNFESRKAAELDQNPFGALCAHWPEIGEQFRIEGRVDRVEPSRSDAYFSRRPRGSQLGAWASQQSRPIASREALLARVEQTEENWRGREVTRPPFWGGFRLTADRIEQWIDRASRLHDRWAWTRAADGWRRERLSP